LQELWRVDGAAGQNDKASCVHDPAFFSDTVRHADCPAPVEQETLDERLLLISRFLRFPCGIEVGAHSRPTLTMVNGHVQLADTLLGGSR
jgi:hypothetical protein